MYKNLLILLTSSIFIVLSLTTTALAQDEAQPDPASLNCTERRNVFPAQCTVDNKGCQPGQICVINRTTWNCECQATPTPLPCADSPVGSCNGTCPDGLKCGHDLETNKCICAIPVPVLTRPPEPTPSPTPNTECNGFIVQGSYNEEDANSICLKKHCDNPIATCKIVEKSYDSLGNPKFSCGCITPTPTPEPTPTPPQCKGYNTGYPAGETGKANANEVCFKLDPTCPKGLTASTTYGCFAAYTDCPDPSDPLFRKWYCDCVPGSGSYNPPPLMCE